MTHGNEPVQDILANPIAYGIAMSKRKAVSDRAWLALDRLIGLGMGLFVGWILWA